MRVAVAGSSGLMGSALTRHLAARGHVVHPLVRRPVRTPLEIEWDPDAGRLEPQALRQVDAVVNLGGAGLGDHRWTGSYRRTLVHSRVRPTALLATTLAALDDGPRVMLQGTAVGVYGDRGDEPLTEQSPPGEGFLAQLVQDWEAATQPAAEAGVRVATLRTGIVLSPRGGSFGRLMPLIRLGLGGPLGRGQHHWPWITLPDHVRATEHLLTGDLSGPVNLTAPEPAPQVEIVRAVARALHRPAVVPVPRFALRIVLGEFADDLLTSQRAAPAALLADGFRFRHADLAAAAAWLAGGGTDRTVDAEQVGDGLRG